MLLSAVSIRTRIVLATTVLSALILGGFGAISLSSIEKIAHDAAESQHHLSLAISGRANQKIESLSSLLTGIGETLSQAPSSEGRLNTQKALNGQMATLRTFFDGGLFYFDNQGRFLASSEESYRPNSSLLTDGAVLSAIKTRKLVASILVPVSDESARHHKDPSEHANILLAKPIIGGGKIIGVIAGVFNADKCLDGIRVSPPQKAGTIFVLSKEGYVVFGGGSLSEAGIAVSTAIKEKVANRFVGITEIKNGDGGSFFGSFSRLQTTDWTMVSLRPVDEVFGVAYSQRALIVIFLIGSVLVIATFISVTMKYAIEPLDHLANRIEHIDVCAENIPMLDKTNDCHEAKLLTDSVNRLTDRINTQAAIRREHESAMRLTSSVFEHTSEGILIADSSKRIISVNKSFSRITGYAIEDVKGKTPKILQSGMHDAKFYANIWRTISKTGGWKGEIWSRRRDGSVFAEMTSINVVKNDAGQITHYVSVFSDITAIKDAQRMLENMANYDMLTGLPNRLLLSDRIKQSLAHASRLKQVLAVCFMDLDGFKMINDQYGHDVGDRLLIEVASRLKAAARDGDTVARIGGDEFVFLLTDLSCPDEINQVLDNLMASVSLPFVCGDQGVSFSVSASIGVAFYPDDDADEGVLLRHADQAMYKAKQMGRSCIHFFNPEEDRQIQSGIHQAASVRAALRAGEMVLFYQPKVNMKTGEIVGVEALLRWDNKEDGILAPNRFLIGWVDAGLVMEIGDWVINEALKQMAEWKVNHGLDIGVSVNISALHLLRQNFEEDLLALLKQYPSIDPSRLELEILETDALEDVSHVRRVIDGCHQIGVTFAVDDFGTGYSSLLYLKHLPVGTLKIDQSFVLDMINDKDNRAIVAGVVSLAEVFNRRVIAEGVESANHAAMLMTMGCDLAQGYGISRPLPAADLPQWARVFQEKKVWHGWQ